MCVLSIKVPIRKKSGNLSYAPRIYALKIIFNSLVMSVSYKLSKKSEKNILDCISMCSHG